MQAPVAPLVSPKVTLRELRQHDADSLFSFLSTGAVGQFISPPPPSADRFARFIAWTERQRDAGRLLCLGIIPTGEKGAVGLIQVRPEAPRSSTAEWGFALSEKFWGTGLFVASAELAMEYLFEEGGVHRLEARTLLANERGNGVLKKLGATREAVLRRGFHKGEQYLDQVLWSILADEWIASKESRRKE